MKSCQPIYLDTPASDVKKVTYIVKKQKDVKMLSASLHGSIHDKQKQCLAGGSDSNAIVYVYVRHLESNLLVTHKKGRGGASVDKLF